MRKDTKKFEILDGFRPASLHASRAKPADHPQPRRGRRSSYTQCIEPRRQDLPTALTAMEQRLSSLLEDRSRIGQDLHDCILQSLYAIESTVQTRRLVSPGCAANSIQPPQDLTGQINRLIGDIRQMIQGLNGEVVNDSRLMDDLYALKSVYDEIGHMRITLNLHPAAVEVLTRDEEREILTIVREALSNCIRHAHATRATISIRRSGAKIRIHISDDGNGFTVDDNRNRGYGLTTIESRARKIGGILRLHSELGRGTHLTVEFSLEPTLTPV